jgi:hypothetical protein
MYPRMYAPDGSAGEHFTFSMVSTYRSVFSDTLTQKYAARLAAQLIDAVEIPGTKGAAALQPLYDRGLAAFEGDQDRFWDFMIVYATRGAAWAAAAPMVGDDNRPLFAAFMVISAAMGVLDTAADQAGTAFSYGAIAGGDTCFEPKPYHFWMAAGFAYKLKKAGYSAKTVELVARLTGALYEVGSTTEGRNPDEVYFVPEYDRKVNRVRRELTHHFLGAQLGLHAANPPPAAFDATLGRFLDASSPLPVMSAEEMTAKIQDDLTRWKYWTSLTGYYLNTAR